MKKLFCIMLSIILFVGLFNICVFAQEPQTPLIVVTGYGTPALFENYGTPEQKRMWVFSPVDALSYAYNDLKNVLPATAEFLKGKGEQLGYCISEAGKAILPYMYCNPDGTSVADITPMPNIPSETTYAKLKGTLEAYEPWLCSKAVNYVSADNIFIFQYDFRMAVYDISDDLHQYIKDVLEYTGAKKADIFGLSYGGLLVGTYLSRYPTECAIDDAVLDVPALGGTTFATTFIEGKAELPVDELMQYVCSALYVELDVYQLVDLLEKQGVTSDGLNSATVSFLENIDEMPIYWNSLWDLLPTDDYERLKPLLLDEEENAEIIRKSDYIHYQIMPNYTENFNTCMDAGVDISIFTSTGRQNIFGSVNNADLLVDAKLGSGAVCTDLGKRFSDGYKAVGTVCNDASHNHISPAMDVDASAAYLPENTWFVAGQGHGIYANEDCSMKLIEKLLFSGEEIDIHTYDEYPQFLTSSLSLYGVYAKFNASQNGRIGKDDTALTVTNVSNVFPVTITSIETDIEGIEFDLSDVKTLMPGENVDIPFTGEMPQVSSTHATVVINFVITGSWTPCNVRGLDFTIENGEAPEYDGSLTDKTEYHIKMSFADKLSTALKAIISSAKDFFIRITEIFSK